jgi:asparagine synthase (glutamine-hydrolysing)
MARALNHRGPDGQGAYTDGVMGIAHTRLSIIDLEGGAQPIQSNSGAVIAANGEIYNYVELREAYGGEAFRTHSDCEAPLVLYDKIGDDFDSRLRGMYALAIYEPATKTLVLQRDPYGIKPLYYAQTEVGFLFASEPRALFASQVLSASLDTANAIEFLQLKFSTSRRTMFQGIERMLPGETLFVRNGEVVRRTRRDPLSVAAVEQFASDGAAIDCLEERLLDSVKVHTRSDVPYGVFLSGGVDSCSIVAAMSKLGIEDFPCFTVRFPDSELHDESLVARDVALAAHARHIEIEICEAAFWRDLPDVVACMDDPCGDPAMGAFYSLARRAAAEVKVVLCGVGGDEIFAGYRRYERAGLPSFLNGRRTRTAGRFHNVTFAKFAASPWRAGFAASEDAARDRRRTALQRMQALDAADYLPNFILSMLDRTLMAHGVEGRTPFLDSELSSFGFSLPDRLKLRHFKGKWLLRKWLHRAMPCAKPFARKRGFSVPVNAWIAGKSASLANFVCDQSGVRDLFDVDGVHDLFAAKQDAHSGLRWPILFYALWHQMHIVGEGRPTFLSTSQRRAAAASNAFVDFAGAEPATLLPSAHDATMPS